MTLGAIWIEAGRRRTVFCDNYCFNGRIEKVFCTISWLAMKSGYTTIIQSVENRGVSPAKHQHILKTKYPWFGASSLYLMGSAGHNLLWDTQTESDYLRGLLLTSIDAFELSPKRKTAAIWAETQQSDFVPWQRLASSSKTSENLPWNASTGSSSPPAVFTWHCPLRFSPILFDGTWPSWPELSFLRRS